MSNPSVIPAGELLINVNDISMSFNLRKPNGNRATNVYAILRIGHVQLKLPTRCKVNSWQWDKKLQMPIVTGNITEADCCNNLRVYRILSKIRQEYLNFYSYLCKNSVSVTVKRLRELINEMVITIIHDEDMNKDKLDKSMNRSSKASTQLEKAFDLYYGTYHQKTKESSKEMERAKLNAFISYCKENGLDDYHSLSQHGLNTYQHYLMNIAKELGSKGNSNRTINLKCQFIERMINFMVGNDSFSRYKLSKVKYQPLEEVHVKGVEKKRRPLTNAELDKLMSCNALNNKEKEYRDLFILECNAGYRISDTPKLFDSSMQRRHVKNGNEYITIVPQKEETKNIIAVILLNDTIKAILERYKDGFDKVDLNNKTYNRNFTYNLRNICKKAGLDSTEKWIDAKGYQHEDKLYDIIGSHFARYTFIYHGLFDIGLTPDELKDFTGHADDTMINEVYKVYSEEDIVTIADMHLNRAMAKAKESSHDARQIDIVGNLLNALFAYDTLIKLKNADEQGINIEELEECKEVIKTIKQLPSVQVPTDINKSDIDKHIREIFPTLLLIADTQTLIIFTQKIANYNISNEITKDNVSDFIKEIQLLGSDRDYINKVADIYQEEMSKKAFVNKLMGNDTSDDKIYSFEEFSKEVREVVRKKMESEK